MPRPLSPAPWLVAVFAVASWGLTGCAPAAKAPAAAKSAAAHDHDHDGHGDHADHDHDDHDHDHGDDDHDHPETLAEGIAAIEAAADEVSKHLAAGANDKADGVVHGMGHLLEDLHGLLPKEDLSAEAKAAVTKALDELFDCFDKLDTALHAPAGKGESPAEVHETVAARVEAAIKALKEAK
jgi:hypothetical protein